MVQTGATLCSLVHIGDFGAVWCNFVSIRAVVSIIRIGQLSRDVIGRLSVTSKPRSYWL